MVYHLQTHPNGYMQKKTTLGSKSENGGVKHRFKWLFVRCVSLSLSIFVVFVGIWWWVHFCLVGLVGCT